MDDCIQVLPITASHVVAVPYPGRGHVNPMMNLCKLLLSKNSDILVSFVVTEEWLGFIGSEPKPDNIGFATIPNVIPSEHGRASDFVGFFESVMTKMEAPFEELLHRLQPLPTLIIYDTYLFWVVRVANSRNIPVASFWPMSASVFAVFKHYHLLQQNGHYPVNVSEDGEKRVDYIPGNSSIRLADFPLNDENWRSRKLLELALNVIPWVQKAQYLLFPSIYELEPQAIDALKSELSIPIYTVGPVIPYFGNGHIDFSNFADHELGYFQWLENQPSGSVLYISQGSFLSVSNEQIDEIAAGVRESGVRFLWVQRGENDRLKDICGDKGLVLQWCDQLRVLQHHAIGGFWSHCGWNSTREGVFSGVPFLTFPIFMDQPLNGKLIVEEWKVGWRVRTKVKEDTLITKDEIASLIRKFMHLGSDEVRDMRKRSRELKQLCHGAIASVGDLHGDLKQARSALEMAGVLSSDGQDLWTGGETVLVQLGDILDRGEDEIAILSLLRSLDKQAKAKGGAVFQVNGNHETMNVEGDFRYVDSGGFDECNDFLEYINGSEDNWEETFTAWVDVSERWKEDRTMSKSYWGPWNLLERQKGVIARSILFRPGGLLARELARHAVVLKVNDWVFCHGGLLPHHVAYGLERMNKEVSEWMRGQHEDDNIHKKPFIATRGYDSVVWNRLYSRDTLDLVDYQDKQVCSILDETLQAVGAKAMVVGHTPQTIGVNCKYNCSIWRVDVGMSSGVLNSRPEVLEIIDDKARVIRCKRDRHSELQAAAYT